ncbi:Mechanosensitive ion channel protein [Seminavis robusta]|uniref:Mechanosensitive ion channel protein n=1 Tax=Seminavis robusta TaxID=568900 RepID=A0A9N8D627_9STRA|nr:Mechanosensitive ion channel protein [Seminavis robusta]|eukprot:Sro9_g007600.1 Mechanosensitive ion channel protein (1058) ;mRNA; r:194332-198855
MPIGSNGQYQPVQRGPPPESPNPPRSSTNSPVPPPASALQRPKTVTHEHRNVSWQSDLSPMHSPVPTPTRRHDPSPSIDLHDMLASGPHELEAETHILRAVEKIVGQAHQKTNTETFDLFGTIAHDEITQSMVENDKEEKQKEKQINTDDMNETSTSAGGTMTPKFQGLIQHTTEVQVAAAKGDGTVEQTLFGLTNALYDLGDHHSSEKKKQDIMVSEDFQHSLNAVDKLAITIDEHVANADDNNNNAREYSESGTEYSVGSSGAQENSTAAGAKKKKKRKRRNRFFRRRRVKQIVSGAKGGIQEDYELFQEFVGGKRQSALSYARQVVLFIVLPSMLMAVLLFYFVENPEKDEYGNVVPGQPATASWWFLFLGVRLVITLTMALITQALVIDFLALGSRFSLQWMGPIFTLLVVQSKGWPFISTFWGAYNFILLSGGKRYARHWLYQQDKIGLFNEDNPGNGVLDGTIYQSLLRLMLFAGILAAIKRLVVGLMLGRQTFAHYGQELAVVMKNMVLVGEVATLAREIEKDKDDFVRDRSDANKHARSLTDEWDPNEIADFVNKEAEAALEAEEEAARNSALSPSATEAATTFMAKHKKGVDGSTTSLLAPTAPGDLEDNEANAADQDFTASEQYEIEALLDAWEEPKRAEESEERKITLGAIMQFRQALSFMKRKYPFLPAFGPADTRDRCIESSQAVYQRLLLRTPHLDEIPFETLALLAKDESGGINQDKAKELIKIFRPERDGTLGKLEFVKSIDAIYKQLRLLSANIANSSQIDKAIESLINFVFYGFLACMLLADLGGSPRAVYLSFSSAILGFSFMFGATSAKYFEGLLFILVQRPYGVGDRIHLSNPQNETSPDGSSGWIVEKVTLTTTTVYWGTTNERATLNNGAISNLRVINAARSPNATIYVELKFGIDTPYEKIAIFRAAVEQFLKDRPREWLTFIGFRPTEVAVDRGFLGYKIIAQHRNHWQGVGAILLSKADLTTYCLEVARILDIRYLSPPLPVDLTMNGNAANALKALQPVGLDQAKLSAALEANSPKKRGMRGQHEAFGAD